MLLFFFSFSSFCFFFPVVAAAVFPRSIFPLLSFSTFPFFFSFLWWCPKFLGRTRLSLFLFRRPFTHEKRLPFFLLPSVVFFFRCCFISLLLTSPRVRPPLLRHHQLRISPPANLPRRKRRSFPPNIAPRFLFPSLLPTTPSLFFKKAALDSPTTPPVQLCPRRRTVLSPARSFTKSSLSSPSLIRNLRLPAQLRIVPPSAASYLKASNLFPSLAEAPFPRD